MMRDRHTEPVGDESVRARWVIVLVLLLLVMSPMTADAHWRTQDIVLNPGWNAVYLEVDPEPRETAAALTGVPVSAVWAWNPSYSTVQYVQDPSTLIPGQPDWLVYFAPGAGGSVPTTLFTLRGGRGYLVYLTGTAQVTWHVTGQPVTTTTHWLGGSYNFVGFQIDPAKPATFATYFAPSAAHKPITVYRLNRSTPPGQWDKIADPTTAKINPGEAYWVYSTSATDFSGPLQVTLEQGGEIDFGRVLEEQTVRFSNQGSSATQIALALQPAAVVPTGQAPSSGAVHVSYWDGSTVPGKWVDLSAGAQFSVAAQAKLDLRLSVRRAEMPGSLYQSLVQVRGTSGAALGQSWTIPVLARGLAPQQAGPGQATPQAGVNPHSGLWVGTATINAVTNTAAGETAVSNTASEMGIRIIVHVDGSGQAKLLQNVTLMWKDGTTKPDPSDPSKQIVDQPGHYVLVTREDLLGQFKGGAVRDGKQIGRRFSSAAFAFRDPIALNGSFDTRLSGQVVLDYDDPVNPFKHRYHPDHDNLDARFDQQLPEGEESYTITRSVVLAFSPTDPDGLQVPGFNDTQVGGTYKETLEGLHQQPIKVAGTFRLTQVSRVPVLDDKL